MKKILLTQNKIALVDKEDYELLNKHKWCYSHGYAVRTENKKKIYMHRFIFSNPKGMDIDHLNHNTLDNRKGNLRVCAHAKNLLNQKVKTTNKSGYKGVFRVGNKWRAQIQIDSKSLSLGYFFTPEEANKAYKQANEIYINL